MNADPQRWLALERELDGLLAVREADRMERLQAVARERPDDARQLGEWLQAIERSHGFLEAAPALRASGAVVGSWRLLRPLGAGGMGEVWLAERTDGAFAKQVAIKFLRHDASHLRERFAQERQVLARLEHPGVARLIDAGVTAGQPYLVTEFVDGLPLDAWCERHAPDLETRLALFAAIGAAVAYAHANLIVHRDLKPANVLVDRDGRPRLLDFGIAKLIDAPADARTVDAALTPAFAAPEQLTGAAITTRTDVYALGALLYWLLSARVPLDTHGLAMAALVARICSETPPLPSAVCALGNVDPRRVRGDLDAIALKALAKEPAERYASVEALLADLDNAAQLRPVVARRPGRAYRARRFVRRHWLGSTTAAAFALAIAAGIGGTIWQARIATRERDAALAQARRNGSAYDFILRLFAEHANAPQKLGVDDLIDKTERDPARAGGPDTRRDTALAVLGELQYLRGSYRAAAAILEPLLRSGAPGLSAPERFRAQCQLAASFGSLGEQVEASAWLDAALSQNPKMYGADRAGALACHDAQSYLLRRADDLDGAVEIDRVALRELQADPDADRNLLAQAHGNLGFSLSLATHYREAIAETEQSIAIYRELGRGETDDVASALASIGLAQMRAGLTRASQASFDEAIALHRRTNGPSTWLAETLVHAAQLKDTLGDARAAHALLDEAEGILSAQSRAGSAQHVLLKLERTRAYNAADDAPGARAAEVALAQELAAHFPPDHFFFDVLALSEANTEMLDTPDAAALDAARAAAERAVRGMRNHPTSRRLLPAALIAMARVALRQGRTADALAALDEARERLIGVEDPAGWQLAYVDALTGAAMRQQGETQQGDARVLDALPRLRAQLGDDNTLVREARTWLASGGDHAATALNSAR